MIIAALAAVAALQLSPADLTRILEASTSMQALRDHEQRPIQFQTRGTYQCDLAQKANDEIAELQENLVHGRIQMADPALHDLVALNKGDFWYSLSPDDRKTIEIAVIRVENEQKNAELACKS